MTFGLKCAVLILNRDLSLPFPRCHLGDNGPRLNGRSPSDSEINRLAADLKEIDRYVFMSCAFVYIDAATIILLGMQMFQSERLL